MTPDEEYVNVVLYFTFFVGLKCFKIKVKWVGERKLKRVTDLLFQIKFCPSLAVILRRAS